MSTSEPLPYCGLLNQNWFDTTHFLHSLQAKYSTDRFQLIKRWNNIQSWCFHRLRKCWTSSHHILIFSSSRRKDFIFWGELFLFKYLSEEWHAVKSPPSGKLSIFCLSLVSKRQPLSPVNNSFASRAVFLPSVPLIMQHETLSLNNVSCLRFTWGPLDGINAPVQVTSVDRLINMLHVEIPVSTNRQ